MSKLRVLLLDDNDDLRKPLKTYLEETLDFKVDGASSSQEALELVAMAQGSYDVALIDEVLQEQTDGIEVMQQIKSRYPDIECIIFTGWQTRAGQRALQAGAFRYLEKPFDNDELETLIRSAGQQVRLRPISRDILSELDLDQALAAIVSAAPSLALADEAAIALLDRSSNKLKLYTRDYPPQDRWSHHFQGRNLSRDIIHSGRIVSVPDIAHDDRADPRFVASGLRSFIGIPVLGESDKLGVLYVYSCQPNHFDSWVTVAPLQTLAGQAGLAIANAQAYEQIRLHAGYMEALVRAGHGLTRTTDQQDQLALAWDFVREQLNVSTFYVALYDDRRDSLQFPLAYDRNERIEIPGNVLGEDPSRWGATGYVVKTGNDLSWPTAANGQELCRSLGIQPYRTGRPAESSFYLPLKAGDRVTGVISVQSYEPYAFTPILLDAFRTLGSQLSVALQNARLFESQDRRRHEAETLRDRLDSLQELALTLTSSLELDKTLEAACRAAVEFFDTDHTGLVLFDADLTQGCVRAEYPKRGIVGSTIPLKDVLAEQWLMQVRGPLVIFDVAAEKSLGPVRDMLLQSDIRSILIVPVVGKEGVLLGSFSLDSVGRIRHFTQEEIELCRVFAPHVAVAVENALLFESTREGRAYIQSLYESSSAIISPTEPDQVLQAIVETARRTTNAWRTSVLLLDEGDQPKVLAQMGFDYTLEPANTIRHAGVSWHVIRSQSPSFFPDTLAVQDEVNPDMLAQGTRAAACLPLLLRDRAIGVLWVQFREPHPFSQAEQQALQVYANQSAVAYDHARRMRELEHLRLASDKLASAAGVHEVLQQIVTSAREVLEADSTVIWSYDDARHMFVLDELVADAIPDNLLERFRRYELTPGGTAEIVMQRGYLAVDNMDSRAYDFLGRVAHGLRGEIGVKAFQGITLRLGDERLGVLYVDYVRPRSFSSQDKATLETLAYHAALALKRARLLEQEVRIRTRAQRVIQAMTLGDLTTTLQWVVKVAGEVLRSDIVMLYTFDEGTRRFNQVVGDGYSRWKHIRQPAEINEGSILWRMLDLEEPYYHFAENAFKDKLFAGEFVEKERVQSSLGMLLRFEDLRVGVLFLNYRTPHRFSSDELATVHLFAHQAAIAIRNAQLYEETSRRASALQALYEAGRAVTGSLALPEILDRIVQQAILLINGRRGSGCLSYLALKEHNRLQFTAASSIEILERLKQQVGNVDLEATGPVGIIGRVARTGQAENISDVMSDPDYYPIEPRTRSEMAVPIKIDSEVFGVINVEHSDLNAFRTEDLRALENLAAQAAIAIRNAKSYKDLEDVRDQKLAAQAVAWLGLFGADWQHTINQKAFSIHNYTQGLRTWLAKRDGPEDITNQVLQALQRIENVVEGIRSVRFVSQFPNQAPGEAGGQMAIDDDLPGIVERWCGGRDDVRVVFDLACSGVEVRILPQWLKVAMEKLINNALKAMPSGGQLTIATRRDGDKVCVTIKDTGRGIPDFARPYFLKRSIPRGEGEEGSGMGALIARFIALQHGGDLVLGESRPGKGTELLLTLPVVPE